MKFHLLLSYSHLRSSRSRSRPAEWLGIPKQPLRCTTTKLGPGSVFQVSGSVLVGGREGSGVVRFFHDLSSRIEPNCGVPTWRHVFCSSRSFLVHFETNSKPYVIHFAEVRGNSQADWAVYKVKLQDVYTLVSVAWVKGRHFVLYAQHPRLGMLAGVVDLGRWLQAEVFWPETFRFRTWWFAGHFAPFALHGADRVWTTDQRVLRLSLLDLGSGDSQDFVVRHARSSSFVSTVKAPLQLACTSRNVLVATLSVGQFDKDRHTYHAVCVDLASGHVRHVLQLHELSIDDHERCVFKTFTQRCALLCLLVTQTADLKLVRWHRKKGRLVQLAQSAASRQGFGAAVQAASRQTVFKRFAWNEPKNRLLLWTVAKAPQKGAVCVSLYRFGVNL